MIIVIGKEDRALLKDAQVYLRERGKIYLTEKPIFGNPESNKKLKDDCFKIARRICKALRIPTDHLDK